MTVTRELTKKNKISLDFSEVTTYMPFLKSRYDTSLVTFWSTLPRNTHGVWSPNKFSSILWELFYDFNIF